MGFLTRIAKGLAVHGYFTVNGSDRGRRQGFRPTGDGLDRTRGRAIFTTPTLSNPASPTRPRRSPCPGSRSA
jgi:hypothetical protein